MGNADRRNSRKMRNRRSQAKLHARQKRRSQEAYELRKAGKKVKQPMFSGVVAAPAEKPAAETTENASE